MTSKWDKLRTAEDNRSAGEVPTDREIVDLKISRIRKEIFESDSSLFLDPGMGNGAFVFALIEELRKYGHSMENIQRRIYGGDIRVKFFNRVKNRLANYNFQNIYHGDSLTHKFDNVKFDVIISSCSFKNVSQKGENNKTYNGMWNLAKKLIKDDGIITMITPPAALNRTKRSTVASCGRLKYIDYSINNTAACSWLVDNKHCGEVMIVSTNGKQRTANQHDIFFDEDKVDVEFVNLFHSLKSRAHKHNRIFSQNTVFGKYVKVETDECKFPLYTYENKTKKVSSYIKRVPHFYGEKKLVFCTTKKFDKDCGWVSDCDWNQNHLCIGGITDKQIENILSFVYCEWFVDHCVRWKAFTEQGFNEALKYIPKFDINKKWDNKSVEEFMTAG